MSVDIRSTRDEDHEAVIAVVREAFTGDGRDGHEEVDIVRATWRLGASPPGFDIVAVDAREVVGHLLAAFGDLGGRPLLAIAPLAVRPDHQRAGVGSALVEALLERADAAGLPAVVLLGSPTYYGRFGFEAAAPLGLTYPPVSGPAFQVRRLAGYAPSLTGTFRYCWEDAPASTSTA